MDNGGIRILSLPIYRDLASRFSHLASIMDNSDAKNP